MRGLRGVMAAVLLRVVALLGAQVAHAAAEAAAAAAGAAPGPASANAAACPAGADAAGGCWPPGADYVPTKGIDLNHSGMSPHVGPFKLSVPAWSWEEPDILKRGYHVRHKVFETSPILDKDLNVYIASSTGWLYSLDKNGKLRWEYRTSAADPGNAALLGGKVFVATTDGTVSALDSGSGRELWRQKIAKTIPRDKHSLTAVPGRLLVACNPEGILQEWRGEAMNEAVCALDPEDGRLRWTFFLHNVTMGRAGMSTNSMPAIVDGSVIVSDNMGSAFRLSLEDGRELWHTPRVLSPYLFTHPGMDLGWGQKSAIPLPWGTKATSVVGPNDKVYHAFNRMKGDGLLRAYDLHTGKVLWARRFQRSELHTAPAVGRLQPGGKLVLVLPLGDLPAVQPPPRLPWKQRLSSMLGLSPSAPSTTSQALAIDAENGDTVWTFRTPPFDGRVAGNWDETVPTGMGNRCLPEVWGSPTIGADGTVYLNWSGGKSFALRDANGDKMVDGRDPQEVSSYHTGFGSSGASAIGPGYLVVPTCRKILAFRS